MHILFSTIGALALLLGVAMITPAPIGAPVISVKDDRAVIECAALRAIASPHFIARADRDAAALPAASPLVAIHGAFKRIVSVCAK